MTITDINKEQYNKYLDFPDISYNCVSYLIKNNETIWKLLKYTTSDAWSKSKADLTQAEKGALIWNGQPTSASAARVFLDLGFDDSITDEIPMLRISPIDLYPSTYIYVNVSIAFDVIAQYKIKHLSNYKTRLDMMAQQIIEVMNGSEIGALGRLYFDARASSACRLVTMGAIPFKGRRIVMCNYIT